MQLGTAPISTEQQHRAAAQKQSDTSRQLLSPYKLGENQYDLARALSEHRVDRPTLVNVFGESAVKEKEIWLTQNTYIKPTNEWISTAELQKFSSYERSIIMGQGTAKFNAQQKNKSIQVSATLNSLAAYRDKNDPSKYNTAQAVLDGKTTKEKLAAANFDVSTLDADIAKLRAYNTAASNLKSKPYATFADNSISVDLSAALRDNIPKSNLKMLGYADADIQKAAEVNTALTKINDPRYRNADGSYNTQAIYHDMPISSGMVATLFVNSADPAERKKQAESLKAASRTNLAQVKKELKKEFRPGPSLAQTAARTYLEFTVPGYATQRHWSQMSPAQRAMSIGLDITAVLLVASPVVETGGDIVKGGAQLASRKLSGQAFLASEKIAAGAGKFATGATRYSAMPVMKGVLATAGGLSAANTVESWNSMNNIQRTFSVGITALLLTPALISTGKYLRNSAIGEFKVEASRINQLAAKQLKFTTDNLRTSYGAKVADAFQSTMNTSRELSEAYIDRASVQQNKGWRPQVEGAASKISRIQSLNAKITALENQLQEQANGFSRFMKQANMAIASQKPELLGLKYKWDNILGINDEFYSGFGKNMVKNTRSAAEAITGTGKGDITFYKQAYESAQAELQAASAKLDKLATEGKRNAQGFITDPDFEKLNRSYMDMVGRVAQTQSEYELAKAGSLPEMFREHEHIQRIIKNSQLSGTMGGLPEEQMSALLARDTELRNAIGRSAFSGEIEYKLQPTYELFPGREQPTLTRMQVIAEDGTYEYRFKGYQQAIDPKTGHPLETPTGDKVFTDIEQWDFEKTSSAGLRRSGSGGRSNVIEMEPPKTSGGSAVSSDLDVSRMTAEQVAKTRGGLPYVHAVSPTAPGITAVPKRAGEPEIAPGHLSAPEIRTITGGSPEIARDIQSIVNSAIDNVPANSSKNDTRSSIENSLRNAAESATSTETKTQLQQKMKTLVEIATDRATERGTPKSSPPAIILKPGTKNEVRLTSQDLKGAVARKQGFNYKLILQSGAVHDTHQPIPGVPLLTGTGSARSSIISVGEGLSRTVIEPRGGMFETQITPARERGGRPTITFRRKKRTTPSTTIVR